MKRTLLFLTFITLAVLLMTNCPEDVINEESSFKLSGTLESTNYLSASFRASGPSDGRTAYIKLVKQGGDFEAAILYSTTAVFGETTAAYSISGIEEGTYSLWAFIDRNDNASITDYIPDNGDYELLSSKTVKIEKDATQNIEDSDWSEVADPV